MIGLRYRVVGVGLIGAPVLHPMSEGLFNFVIEWTFMFCSSAVHGSKEDRHKWSLDALRGFQMFLTISVLLSKTYCCRYVSINL
ncbi:unnamed protein product [Malus baccata var. baccata]